MKLELGLNIKLFFFCYKKKWEGRGGMKDNLYCYG